jgi:hypothetical protein
MAACRGTSCLELCTAASCKCPPCGVCPACRRRTAIATAPRPELTPPSSPPDLDRELETELDLHDRLF